MDAKGRKHLSIKNWPVFVGHHLNWTEIKKIDILFFAFFSCLFHLERLFFIFSVSFFHFSNYPLRREWSAFRGRDNYHEYPFLLILHEPYFSWLKSSSFFSSSANKWFPNKVVSFESTFQLPIISVCDHFLSHG